MSKHKAHNRRPINPVGFSDYRLRCEFEPNEGRRCTNFATIHFHTRVAGAINCCDTCFEGYQKARLAAGLPKQRFVRIR